MRLDDYMWKNRIKTSAFASKIAVADTAVQRYRAGKRVPHATIMARIYLATDGQVAPNDFYDLPDLEPAEAKETVSPNAQVPAPNQVAAA